MQEILSRITTTIQTRYGADVTDITLLASRSDGDGNPSLIRILVTFTDCPDPIQKSLELSALFTGEPFAVEAYAAAAKEIEMSRTVPGTLAYRAAKSGRSLLHANAQRDPGTNRSRARSPR